MLHYNKQTYPNPWVGFGMGKGIPLLPPPTSPSPEYILPFWHRHTWPAEHTPRRSLQCQGQVVMPQGKEKVKWYVDRTFTCHSHFSPCDLSGYEIKRMKY